MFVSERMSHPVITIHPNTSLQDAMHLMQVEHIRRLPVIDNHGKMVGIVTESDLLRASPSDVTSLSVWEMGYLLSKITIDKIMVREVIAVNENTPIEEAARVMADHKVGGLPVLRNGNLVGIITDTDLFKIFLELFGAREAGTRLTALLENKPGTISAISKAIFEAGGNIIAIGTTMGPTPKESTVILKVDGIPTADLDKIVLPHVIAVLDVREMPGV